MKTENRASSEYHPESAPLTRCRRFCVRLNRRSGTPSRVVRGRPNRVRRARRCLASRRRLASTALLFQVVRPKHAVTAGLNDDGALSRSEKVRHIRRNEYEAASGIGVQLRLVEPLSNPQVPRTLDNGDDFVIRMRVCEDARTARLSYAEPSRAAATTAGSLTLTRSSRNRTGAPMTWARCAGRNWMLRIPRPDPFTSQRPPSHAHPRSTRSCPAL